MATFTFAPTATINFTFQATFDGALYNVTTMWNVSRQGWYFNVFDQSNTLIVSSAFVGSPDPPQPGVNLVGGYFTTSTMFYYPDTGTIVVSP
jgi:hypothetical protein